MNEDRQAVRDVGSTRRFAIFGSAVLAGNLGQLTWLMLGSRAMPTDDFGAILAAQALYSVLLLVVDNGSGMHGARLAAAGSLGAGARASLVRLRLQLAFAMAILAVTVGLLGGRQSFLAIGPFVVALVLFAAFGYWERFGLGDSGPWSAYLVLRAFGPAFAAAGCLVASVEFPLVLAGVIECIAILLVAGFFRLRPRVDLVAALSARPGPWRTVVAVGLPAILWQIGLSSGTVLLSTFGAAAAAAALGVAIRLLTGLNQLSATAVTALFPKLAATRGGDSDDAHEEHAATVIAARLALAAAAVANAVLLISPSLVLGLFFPEPGETEEQVAIIVLASAVATSYVVSMTLVLIARGREALSLRAILAGTVVVCVGSCAVVLTTPESNAQWMAGAFLIGELVTLLLVCFGLVRLFPSTRRTQLSMASIAATFAAVGALGATVPSARVWLAVVPAAAAVGAIGLLLRDVRSMSAQA